MYCRNCSRLLPEGARFCPYCGAPAPETDELPEAASLFEELEGLEEITEEPAEEDLPEAPEQFGEQTVVLSREELDQFAGAVYNADMPNGPDSRRSRQPVRSSRAYDPAQEESSELREAEEPQAGNRKGIYAAVAVAAIALVILTAVLTVKLLSTGGSEDTTSQMQTEDSTQESLQTTQTAEASQEPAADETTEQPGSELTEDTEDTGNAETDSEAENETTETLTQSEQAQAFYDAGDYNGAEVLLYTMRRAGEMTAEDYALYGLVLQAQDRSDSAVTMYYEGYTETGEISLRDAGTALALELAEAAIDKGDYEVAQIWYETVLDYDAENAAATAGLETVDAILNPVEPVYETVYTVIAGSYTWEEAQAEAEARGGQLAVIADADVFDQIAALLDQTLLTAAWVGARTDEAGQWEDASWVDGTAVNYALWADDEPDGDGNGLALIQTEDGWRYADADDSLTEQHESMGFVMETQVEVTQ